MACKAAFLCSPPWSFCHPVVEQGSGSSELFNFHNSCTPQKHTISHSSQHTPVARGPMRWPSLTQKTHCFRTAMCNSLCILQSSSLVPLIVFLCLNSSVGQQMVCTSLLVFLPTAKWCFTCTCLIPFPVEQGQFFCNDIELLLPCRRMSSRIGSP